MFTPQEYFPHFTPLCSVFPTPYFCLSPAAMAVGRFAVVFLLLALLQQPSLRGGVAAEDGFDGPHELLDVEVMQGALRGSLMTTRSGRSIASFRGIPYAEPPLGDLRFRAPVPVNGWHGVLDATNEAPPCIQRDLIFEPTTSVINGQEDCLYLNVYAPLDVLENVKLAVKEGKLGKKLPVMVYIHGGGWAMGSGASFNYGPQYLLDKEIILVTMNYRLSAFGFLSTGDNTSPGNYGLKDQNLALKWINENIAAFGGDQEKITIFGQSAGGASVHYHVLSPMSKGLFQNAILHSGNALAPWALSRDAPDLAKRLASYLNCPTNKGSQMMVDCLRTKDALEITKQFEKFPKWDIDPLLIFAPTIENEGNDEPPFISEHPYQIMKSGKFNHANLMAGITKEDGAFRSGHILANEGRVRELNDEFYERVGPITLRVEETADDPKEVARKVREHYFGDNAIGIQTHKELTELYNDRLMLNGLISSFELMTSTSLQQFSSYLYMFSHRGKLSILDNMPIMNKTTNTIIDLGVAHCDELMYLFPMREFTKVILEGDDLHMSKIMLELWTDFAEVGNPTPTQDNLIPLKWTPAKPNDLECLHIGGSSERLKLAPLSDLKNYKFWKSLNLKENENYVSPKKRDEL